jgi:hypothetical protein
LQPDVKLLPDEPPDEPSSPGHEPPNAPAEEPPAEPAMRLGTLLVTVKAASNLLNKDSGLLGQGKSDPYVVVTVPSGKKEPHTAKTKYISDNLNPVWNEEKTFAINQRVDTVGKIRFEVFDSDVVGTVLGTIGDNTLGFIDVDWPFWDEDTDGSFRAPISLNLRSNDEKGKPTEMGHLKCDLVWCPAGSMLDETGRRTPRTPDDEPVAGVTDSFSFGDPQ